MKHVKLLSMIGLLIGFNGQLFSQETLPEVIVMARNYKYLRATDQKNIAQPVKLLERKAAAYDVKNSEYYEDEYDSYSITFYLPSGYVLAVYDATGKLISTAERFKNVALPAPVRNAVATRYPNWRISEDTYLVKYDQDAGGRLVYKLRLANGNKRLRVKANEHGEFLD